eukprot:gene4554-4806_t
MSVVAQSPYSAGSSKRLFNSEEDTGSDQFGAVKRARCLSSPAGRCRPSSSQSPPHNSLSQGVHPSAIAALKALFPDMDEQAVESVLAECGQDIDAAIRRLTELKLSTEQAAATGAVPRAEEPAQQDAAHAASDRQQPEPSTSSTAAAGGGLQTAEQWVDAFVQEMAGAKDFSDARCRAAKMLQAFEQFVTARSKQGGAHGKLEDVLRENNILKRAVQIQNTKLQEASAKDQELTEILQEDTWNLKKTLRSSRVLELLFDLRKLDQNLSYSVQLVKGAAVVKE